MAGNIKGITIEFRGDTTKLDKAIRQINSEARDLDKELRNIDKALKFNPTSIELWRQKQDNLNDKISTTNEKLNLLRETQKKVDSGEIEMSAQEYRELRRQIIECESKSKTFAAQLKKVDNALQHMDLINVSNNFKKVGTSLEKAGQSMRGVSIAAAGVVAAYGTLSVKSGQWADDLNTMSKVYSIGTDELQKYSAAADLVDVSVETIAKSHVKLEKQMLTASKGTGASAEAFEALGVQITNADGSLRDGDAVWQDTIKALGSMTNETERDAYAMQLMGRSAAELNPLIEDGGETYKRVSETMSKYGLDFVDQETLNKANEFNDQLDTMKAIGTVALQSIGTQLAGYLAPALEKVVGWIGQLANWLSNLDPRVQTIIATIAGVLAVTAPLLMGLGKLAFAISSITGLMATAGVSFAAIAGPIGIAIAAVAAAIAIFKLWQKHGDQIKAYFAKLKDNLTATFNKLKTNITTTFNNIKNAIVSPIQNAINKIRSIINTIKGWFPIRIGKIMSGIKLPHFKLTGSFSLTKMTVPKVSISWYKTGGIFDSPSVIGVGEAGSEAVVPLDTLWKKLDNIANASANGAIVVNVYGSDNMSVNELAAAVEQRIIQMQKRRTLAWQ